MKKMLNKILFFGNERLGTGLPTTAPTLRALIAEGYQITGVVVAQNKSSSSRSARELEIVHIANQHKIPVYSPAKLSEFEDELKAMNAEVGVLVAYGKIVPQHIIDLIPKGIINIHPSLLPKHRGPTPIESVIRHGETHTGVTIMQLSAKMDAGPVFVQQSVDVPPTIGKVELSSQLQLLGVQLLIDNLPAILNGSLSTTPQDDASATYDQLIKKSDGLLDFNKSALELEREIRAYAIWPRSRTTIGKTEVVITSAHMSDGTGPKGVVWRDGKELGIYCSQGILLIDELVPIGKKVMPASAFIAGYLTKHV